MNPDNIFGTDGIRDRAGEGYLTDASLYRLGVALARFGSDRTGSPPRVLIGWDSRVSGPDVADRLSRALLAQGARVDHMGIVPTPAVSIMVGEKDYDLGLVISASHNPPEFNGVKVFDHRGWKLDPADEIRITRHYHEASETPPPESGRPGDVSALREEYIDGLLRERRHALTGLRVVLDCARGATTTVARAVYEGTGAMVEVLNEEPDGSRINVGCGSLDPGPLAARVLASGADLGVAFDGDGDRSILVDETGAVDGDEVMALWALDLQRRGELPGHTLVATVMSNAGMESHLREHGIALLRAPVGDREVFMKMVEIDAPLGGEQSGHLIFRPEASTGDGIRTGLHLAILIRRLGQPLSELRAAIPRYPQTLLGITVSRKVDFDELPEVLASVRSVEDELGDAGRVLLRYSGTEPLARVLVEGPDGPTNSAMAERIADVIRHSRRLHD